MSVSSFVDAASMPSSADSAGQSSDADAFFTQSDWEFELDTMQDRSIEALKAHLDRMPPDACPETVQFLRSHILDSQSYSFTNFSD